MADKEINITGSQRAAILMLGLGESLAAQLMKHMEPPEVERVGRAMASLSGVSDEQIAYVLSSFHEELSKVNPIGVGASSFTERVMLEALGEEKARNVLFKVMPGDKPTQAIEALRWMPAVTVANILKQEHPQIGAMILSLLDDTQSGEILPLLDKTLREEVMLRIARLETLDPAAMDELDRVLEQHIGEVKSTPPRPIEGAKSAADILNTVDAQLEGEMLEALKGSDEALGEEVSDLMLVFEHLRNVDDRSMQRLIREVSTDDMMIALKGSDPDLMDKFLDNMSTRAADMLVEDMEAKGPVKLAEMTEAQKKILVIAKKLEEDGEIMLGRKNDDVGTGRRGAKRLVSAASRRNRDGYGLEYSCDPGWRSPEGLRRGL